MRGRTVRGLASTAVAAFALACGGGAPDGPACPIPLPEDCAPLYEPTFEQVYGQTLARSCALSGCHGDGSAQGGLDLDGEDRAWSALVDEGRALPGDPACSEVMLRLHGAGAPLMPPGRALPAAEICAVQRWIEQGATR